LLALGYGITNFVNRATATAAELTNAELLAGGQRLTNTIHTYRPRVLAVLGVTAYRAAFKRPQAALGRQTEMIGDTLLWVLPNPSGLNAHYQLADLAELFRELRLAQGD
jgi:TDG/mug DNA glycosylase family protein